MNEFYLLLISSTSTHYSPHSALDTESWGGEVVGREEEMRKSREAKDNDMTFKLAILKYLLEQFPRMFS